MLLASANTMYSMYILWILFSIDFDEFVDMMLPSATSIWKQSSHLLFIEDISNFQLSTEGELLTEFTSQQAFENVTPPSLSSFETLVASLFS